ncbi:hypothetical protein PAMP_021839 [Pampus punctatissimus]
MACNSRSVLFLLRRCASVRQLTLSAGIKTRGGVLSGRCGFIQLQQTTSTTRTDCLRSLSQPQPALKISQHSLCTKVTPEGPLQAPVESSTQVVYSVEPVAPCEDEYPPLPAYQADPEPQKNEEVYIVQVRGLPWSCTTQDLLQFFSECRIRDGETGIHFIEDRQGRPSGQAFIEMEHEEDVNKALEKHRQYLGPRYIEVFEVTNADAEVILKNVIQPPAKSGFVRLRGLPFSCTETDIVHFFSGLDIVENGINIFTDNRGRRSGEAIVQFSSQEAADEALQKDREIMGNRYIEVFPSKSNEIHLTFRKRTSSASQSVTTRPVTKPRTGSQRSYPSPHYIRMRGLPFQVSGEDVVEFFFPLAVSKILIEYGPSGRPSGEANVYFSCHQDAVAAMSRDRQHIGERYIELFLNSAPDSDGR